MVTRFLESFQVIWKSCVVGKRFARSHRAAIFYGTDLVVGLAVAGSLIMSTVSVLCVFVKGKLNK